MPMNYAQTALLLGVMTALFMVTGFVIGGAGGMLIALVMALAMNLFNFYRSDQMVLGMHGAQVVDERAGNPLYDIVKELAERAKMPMPTVAIMHSGQPNAFATGRNPANATVAATTGLLEMLTHEEVAGVMAHELAHIQNRDTLTMTLAAAMGGAIGMLAQRAMSFRHMRRHGQTSQPSSWVPVMIAAVVAPLTATLVKMAISRSREYQADKLGAMMCGNPRWLMSALTKIDGGVRQIRHRTADAHQATAHLFIVNPLASAFSGGLFASHPSMQSRLAELEKLAVKMNVPDLPVSAPMRADTRLNDVLFPANGPRA
jgi:heat shock protein HtpX